MLTFRLLAVRAVVAAPVVLAFVGGMGWKWN